jgi:hypothetical protein
MVASPPEGAAGTSFRPIQYLGNKWRLLDAIDAVVRSVAPEGAPVSDPFAGTGVVAARLAGTRAVYASDIQEYSRVLTVAQLLGGIGSLGDEGWQEWINSFDESRLGQPVRRLIEYEAGLLADPFAAPLRVAELVEYGSLEGSRQELSDAVGREALGKARAATDQDPTSVIFRYYGGPYFSYRQAAALDAFATTARALESTRRTLALAVVISVASDIVSTVGSHFAQPVRLLRSDGQVKSGGLQRLAARRQVPVEARIRTWLSRYLGLQGAPPGWSVSRLDFEAAIRGLPDGVAVVYADPPYTRDHYSRFYHVLETLALGDEPGVAQNRSGLRATPTRAIYRTVRHQSPFSIASSAGPAFERLFKAVAARDAALVLSYSPYSGGTAARPRPRVVTINQLTRQADRYFRYVDIVEAGSVSHSKLNRQELNLRIDHAEEVFLVAK